MENDQLVIKIILLTAIGLVALLIVWPGRGARRLALRRVGLLLVAVVAGTGVAFPDFANLLARLVGVGRGADLLLYTLFVAFVAYVIGTRAHHRRVDIQLTELARALAISQADKPESESL